MTRAGLLALCGLIAAIASVVAWQTEPRQTAGSAGLDGAALFRAKGCATCHSGPSSRSTMDGFPPLHDAASWAGTRRQAMSADAYLAESMRAPSAFLSPVWTGGGPSPMPDLELTQAEIDVLVNYLLQS